MYILVIVAFSILGDLSLVAVSNFDNKKECEALAPRINGVMLRDQVGMVPTQIKAACVTEMEFQKLGEAVQERSRAMEQEGVKAQNSRT